MRKIEGYAVARSISYPDGDNLVEIEKNGLDSLSADTLGKKYPGEWEVYDDPRDAVDAAVKIRDAWIADGAGETGEVAITFGSTFGGMFGPEPFDGTDDELREAAEREYDNLPKCDYCGELRRETFIIYGDPGLGEYCREYCAEMAAEDMDQEIRDDCQDD